MAGTDERIRKVGFVQNFVSRPELGSVFGLAIIVVTFMTMTSISGTFTAMWGNPIGIQAWVELAAFVGILAIGASLLMIAGEFDLSMGANIALAGHSFALLLIHGVPVVPAIILTFMALAFVGYIIGIIVVRTGLPSFIVTLGFWFASRGFAVFLSQTLLNQSRLSVKAELKPPLVVVKTRPGLTMSLPSIRPSVCRLMPRSIISLFLSLSLRLFCTRPNTATGFMLPAVTRQLPVPWVCLSIASKSVFSWCRPALPVFSGVLTVMTSGASDPKAGDFRELHAIAAAVIGGCALTGGYGSVIGAVLGAFIFAIASRGINFVPFIDNNMFRVMLGLLILGAALLNQFLRNRVLRG